MQLREHRFLGMTQSLCPQCLTLVPAKIIEKSGRVYFRKRCPTHGVREDFVCSDVRHYDRMEYSLPGKVPAEYGTIPNRGCPYDCGLCTEHEQHTCLGLVEITSSCNLHCPMCYASSGPAGKHLSFAECQAAIDRLVQVEGRAEVLQLSGGEPTIHPEFLRILEYACSRNADLIMINSNGLRFAHDPAFVEAVARFRHRLEVYLQFDGFSNAGSEVLRGEPLVDAKLRAVEELGGHGVRVILVTTLHPGVNDGDIGAIVKYGLERPWVTGVSFQPATYSGRHVLPADLERRITFPDVIKAIAAQTDGVFREDDFMPLPCAHPNCHSLSYAYRSRGQVIPISRFIDVRNHLEILANGITFTRNRARQLIEQYLGKLACCAGECDSKKTERAVFQLPSPPVLRGRGVGGEGAELPENAAPSHGASNSLTPTLLPRVPEERAKCESHQVKTPLAPAAASVAIEGDEGLAAAASDFFRRAIAEQLSPADVFRITITSFLDAYNFDVRRLMKCCTHHVLPSGHVIPFCAYNVLYREGHVPLPPLRTNQTVQTAAQAQALPVVGLIEEPEAAVNMATI